VSGYMSPRTRPIGIAVVAVLIGIVGIVLVLGGLLVLLLSSVYFAAQVAPLFGAGVVAGAFLLILGVVFLVVASGLWRLEMWALALSVLVVLFLLIDLAVRGALVSLSAVLLVLFLVYLVLVRHHFR